MSRIQTSWKLAKVSWSVLRSDRTLAWFPVFSAIASLIVIGAVAALIGLTGINSDSGQDGLKAIGYVFIAAGYVAMAFVGAYFLAALVHAANERLEGREGSRSQAFAAANAKLHRILPWVLVQATVSIVIQFLEERFGLLGRIIGSMLGAAWGVVTFLTVPIIMLEDLGPIAALERSGELLKRSWGENLIGQAGFGLGGLVAALPAFLAIAFAVAIDDKGGYVAFGGLAAVWIAIVVVVLSAMSGIYRTALYRYACDGAAPAAFAGAGLEHVFAPRRGR